MNIHYPIFQLLTILQMFCFIPKCTPKSDKIPVCAILKNNESESFAIPELYKIPDFGMDYFQNKKPLSSSAQNISLEISAGCQFSFYDETYFRGNKTVGSNPVGIAQSGICSCQKTCLCSSTPVRQDSCAHAWITPCGSCDSKYVEIKEGSENFVDLYASRIKMLQLRGGCSLKTFEEEDSEGSFLEWNNSGQQDKFWNNTAKIASFECLCDAVTPRIEIKSTAEIQRNFTSNHGGLSWSNSLNRRRSPNHAYILVLGSSGSGKSSLINLMFNNPTLSAVGSSSSTTSDIREFRVSVPLPSLGLHNTTIRLIDTPGLGDTRGLENDARFLATFSQFLTNHEDLAHYVPNIVIICHKFTDNRFAGPGSTFTRMLKALNYFGDRISDPSYSNVVFVYTHFLSEISLQKDPGPRLSQFRQVISEYSLLPRPIIATVAENLAAELGLPMFSYNYILPDGELFPNNIYNKIFTSCLYAQDQLGLAIFDSALFKGGLNHPGLHVVTEVSPLLPRNASESLQFIERLTTALLNIEDTPVSQRLSETFGDMPPEFRVNFGNGLLILQKALEIRGIRNLGDVPKTNFEAAALFALLKVDSNCLILLEKAFQLVPPSLSSLSLGHSINVAKGILDPERNDMIQHSDSTTLAPELGYMLPTFVNFLYFPTPWVVDKGETFNSIQSYFEAFAKNIGIVDNLSNIRGVAPAHPINLLSQGRVFKNQTFQTTRELRFFKLQLNLDQVNLSPSFVQSVNELEDFNEYSYKSVELWRNFFAKFGTHLVTSIHGGGLITMDVELDLDLVDDRTSTNISARVKSCRLDGGDVKFQTVNLNSIAFEEKITFFDSWKKSVPLKPALLQSSIGVTSLSEVIRAQMGAVIGDRISVVEKILFRDGILLYKPDPIKVGKLQVCRSGLVQIRNSPVIANLRTAIQEGKLELEKYRENVRQHQEEHLDLLKNRTGLHTMLKIVETSLETKVEQRNGCMRRFKT